MENGHLHDDKLFRAVHDRLSDYEAPYDGADWDAMSRSLDKLPKTSRFQWKFSLNTILVVAGIAGLSLLGYALAKPGSSKPSASTEAALPVAQTVNAQQNPAINSQTSITAGNTEETTGTNVPQNYQSPFLQQNAGGQNTSASGSPSAFRSKKENFNSDLLFGDQIDKRKGFIYKTHEDPSVLRNFQDTVKPNVFYDIENGKVRPIVIHRDSSGYKAEKKEPFISLDSTARGNPRDGAPTNGGQDGFDFEGSH